MASFLRHSDGRTGPLPLVTLIDRNSRPGYGFQSEHLPLRKAGYMFIPAGLVYVYIFIYVYIIYILNVFTVHSIRYLQRWDTPIFYDGWDTPYSSFQIYITPFWLMVIFRTWSVFLLRRCLWNVLKQNVSLCLLYAITVHVLPPCTPTFHTASPE